MVFHPVYLAFGSNLSSKQFPEPKQTILDAIDTLQAKGMVLLKTGRFYETEPIPKSDQNWYINTVALFSTNRSAHETLALCHSVEDEMGRQRSIPNAARVIDIDVIDFNRRLISDTLVCPHPRMHQRAFVLRPLVDINPLWCHPKSGRSVSELILELPFEQSLGQGIRLSPVSTL